ncbi:PREDICTED: probable tubulin beta chain CG32396 [Rhagoletis zephyria]|uniref:probable tubulin beta chain CG32396 n=1 Tax=Rhagoletis zephyria TaxID=28612 RepID=UPI00081198EC|nr:PREDICTED: probable tubulin beta chain CG32396 [Rhagoletis zephyria]
MSAIYKLLQQILDGSGIMLRRKAHLHWHTGKGMEGQESIDAQRDLQDLLDLYKQSGEDTANEEVAAEGHSCAPCNQTALVAGLINEKKKQDFLKLQFIFEYTKVKQQFTIF